MNDKPLLEWFLLGLFTGMLAVTIPVLIYLLILAISSLRQKP